MLLLHRRCVGCSQKMMFRGIRPAGQRVPGRQARDNNHDTYFETTSPTSANAVKPVGLSLNDTCTEVKE